MSRSGCWGNCSEIRGRAGAFGRLAVLPACVLGRVGAGLVPASQGDHESCHAWQACAWQSLRPTSRQVLGSSDGGHQA